MTVGPAARRDGQRTWETCGPKMFRPKRLYFSGGLWDRRPRWRRPTTCGSSSRCRLAEAFPPLRCQMRRTAEGVYRSGRAMVKKGAWGRDCTGEEAEEGTGAPTPPPLLLTGCRQKPSVFSGGAADFSRGRRGPRWSSGWGGLRWSSGMCHGTSAEGGGCGGRGGFSGAGQPEEGQQERRHFSLQGGGRERRASEERDSQAHIHTLRTVPMCNDVVIDR